MLDLSSCESIIRQRRRLPERICDAILDVVNSTGASSHNLNLLIFALCGNIRLLEVSSCPYIWAVQADRNDLVRQAGKLKKTRSTGGSSFMDVRHVNLVNDGHTETDLTQAHLSVFLDLPNIQTLTTDFSWFGRSPRV